MSDNQYAYRKGRSTELALTRFTRDIIKSFEDGKLTIAVFLDLSRAFDCVNHDILIKKLKYYGIRNTELRWFSSYLSNRQQYVYFNGSSSTVRGVHSGVPQGSILGPLLFLLYINDFCHSVNVGTQLLFADGATHYETGTCYQEVLRSVNNSLSMVSEWFLANRLSLNVVKTESMVFTRRLLYFPQLPVIIHAKPIPMSYSVEFLGVMVDMKLNFRLHIDHIQNKLSKSCGILYQIRSRIPLYAAKLIYLTIALPYLNYCNIVWSSCPPSCLQRLNTTQKKLIRLVTKSGRLDHTTPLFHQLRLLKLNELNELNLSLFVYKSINNLISSPINFTQRLAAPYNLRNVQHLTVPFTRSSQTKRFPHVRGASLWNELPIHVRSARTIQTFKKNLKNKHIDAYRANDNA